GAADLSRRAPLWKVSGRALYPDSRADDDLVAHYGDGDLAARSAAGWRGRGSKPLVPAGDGLLWGDLAGTGARFLDRLPPAGHRRPGFDRRLALLHDLLEHHCQSSGAGHAADTDRVCRGVDRSGTAGDDACAPLAEHALL